MESFEELKEVVLTLSFVPVALSLGLLLFFGSGLVRTRWRRLVWLGGLGCLGLAFYLGIQRHEWGEVLFNGQLL